MLKFKIAPFLFLMLALISCAEKNALIKEEPQPEVVIKKINPHDKKFWLNDSARSSEFSAALKKINKITIRYNAEDKLRDIWTNSIEKNLLRLKISVNEEPEKDPLSEYEDAREIRSDAVMVIDKISLIRVDSEKNSGEFIADGSGAYKFFFYIAEIRGKIILKNGDLIWNSSVSVSSFDLLKTAENIDSEITFRKASKFRFSPKLGEWIRDGWSFSAEDNFQSRFKQGYDETRHIADLINMAVSDFTGNIRTENIARER